MARRYHQVSTVGKVLDPVADRVLVVTAVIAIIVHGAVPVWFGVATLAREVVVSAAVLLLASLGAARIDVLWVGKAGTFALMFSYPAFLLGYGTAGLAGPIHVVAWVTGIIGLTLAWIAAASYVPVARKALADGRRGRAAADRGGVPMKAVIMAGGEGTRLRPLTSNQPKPMLPMANIPMMEHVVNLLRQHGFEDIVVTVAFMANAIRTYFGDGSEFGVRMVYATESTPLGTAGSVRNARDELDERFLVISGDVLTDIDLTQVVAFHDRNGGPGHPGPQGRGQPPRVRDRHHRRGRLHRAVPREADLGPGVQRHHQHRHLRARAGDLRLHPRGPARWTSPGSRSPRPWRPARTCTATWPTATGRTWAPSRPTSSPTRTSSTRGSRWTSTDSSSGPGCGWARGPRSTRAWSSTDRRSSATTA